MKVTMDKLSQSPYAITIQTQGVLSVPGIVLEHVENGRYEGEVDVSMDAETLYINCDQPFRISLVPIPDRISYARVHDFAVKLGQGIERVMREDNVVLVVTKTGETFILVEENLLPIVPGDCSNAMVLYKS